MKIPEAQNSIPALIDKYHSENQEKPRPHLGCSMIGHPCERWLWLSFRWAVIEQFEGRMLRLFRRGHNEEASVIDDLKSIGVDVFDMKDGQHRVDFGSHVSGSVDGLIGGGVPGAEKTPHLLEIKTHSKKSFDWLKSKGVEKAKPMHYAQMQVYMHGSGMTRALYYAVCKDNDEIYTERIKHNEKEAQAFIDRGQRIALSDVLPEKMPEANSEQFTCKYCPASGFCHSDVKEITVIEENCRTCGYSTATKEGEWLCERFDSLIPLEQQRIEQECYTQHPNLMAF